MKLEFPGQILEKSSNIKFHENPSSWSRYVQCGQTDRHDATNSRFSQFCLRFRRLAPDTDLLSFPRPSWPKLRFTSNYTTIASFHILSYSSYKLTLSFERPKSRLYELLGRVYWLAAAFQWNLLFDQLLILDRWNFRAEG